MDKAAAVTAGYVESEENVVNLLRQQVRMALVAENDQGRLGPGYASVKYFGEVVCPSFIMGRGVISSLIHDQNHDLALHSGSVSYVAGGDKIIEAYTRRQAFFINYTPEIPHLGASTSDGLDLHSTWKVKILVV